MDRFLTSMAIFIEYPLLAALIGVCLILLGRRARHRTATVVGVIWLLYSIYEYGMKQRLLCSGECNIRVDLLLIYPALIIGLVAAGVDLFRASGRRWN